MRSSNRLKGWGTEGCGVGPGQAEAAILLRQDYRWRGWGKNFLHSRNSGTVSINCVPTKIDNQKALPPQSGIRNSIHSAPGSKDVLRWLQFTAGQPQPTDWGASHPEFASCPFAVAPAALAESPVPAPHSPFCTFMTLLTWLLYVCSKTPFDCHSGNSCQCAVMAWCWDRANDMTRLSLFPQLSQKHQWRRKAVLPGSPKNSEGIWSFLYPPSKFGPLLGNKIFSTRRPLINGTGLTIRKERRKVLYLYEAQNIEKNLLRQKMLKISRYYWDFWKSYGKFQGNIVIKGTGSLFCWPF